MPRRSSARCWKTASHRRNGRRLRESLRTGKSTDEKRANSLAAAALAERSDDRLAFYLDVFFNKDGTAAQEISLLHPKAWRRIRPSN